MTEEQIEVIRSIVSSEVLAAFGDLSATAALALIAVLLAGGLVAVIIYMLKTDDKADTPTKPPTN
jgi:hypothetical protein